MPYAVYAHDFISGSYINIGSHLQATRQEKINESTHKCYYQYWYAYRGVAEHLWLVTTTQRIPWARIYCMHGN